MFFVDSVFIGRATCVLRKDRPKCDSISLVNERMFHHLEYFAKKFLEIFSKKYRRSNVKFVIKRIVDKRVSSEIGYAD